MIKKSINTLTSATIAINRKAQHEYFIEQRLEAGICLSGWEVKSLRANKAQLTGSYVYIKQNEVLLLGAHFSPLQTASNHVVAEPLRERKLLLHKREINRLCVANSKKGYTTVPLAIYWKGPIVKCEIALVKGKKMHDKRAVEKERDWNRQKQRILKNH